MLSRCDAVLIVEEDADSLHQYRDWLASSFDVHRLTGDIESLAEISGVDVFLFERSMPTVLGHRSTTDRRSDDADCLIATVESVDTDTGTVHISSGEFHDGSVDQSTLLESVDRLRRRARYDELLAQTADLAVRRARFESDQSLATLERDPAYRALCRQLSELLVELESVRAEFDDQDYEAAFEVPDFTGAQRLQQLAWLT